VIQANSLSAGLLRPDLNIFIDISPETSMQRLHKTRNTIELYESIENLKRVREKYMEAFERFRGQENVYIVNGERPAAAIADEIWAQVGSITQPGKLVP